MKAIGSRGNVEFTESGKITAWGEYLDLANTAREHGLTVKALLPSRSSCQTKAL
jgi:hypothetical protein